MLPKRILVPTDLSEGAAHLLGGIAPALACREETGDCRLPLAVGH